MQLHRVAVKTLTISTSKRNMPILKFILSPLFNAFKCSHPLIVKKYFLVVFSVLTLNLYKNKESRRIS